MTKGRFKATPTKDFFISMLTKDISLEKAIMDLVDNSVDAAKTNIVDEQEFNNLNNYEIKIVIKPDLFEIKDNCGGFSKKIAENYAFKLGRPNNTETEAENKTNTVGRFGVGMKRGLFKIGKKFEVETKSKSDHFVVSQNVEEWKNDQSSWEFDFFDVEDNDSRLSFLGTKITVTDLHESVMQDFKLGNFITNFKKQLESTFTYSILKGLKIFLNGIEINPRPVEFLFSENLKAYYDEDRINDVDVSIYAGVGEPNPNLAGWYIYCNDRLMVEKDKSNLTGWEGGKKFYDDSGVQKFHNKVAMFRGIVFFNSDDSSKLPMTTTKSGIDVNSTLYKTVRTKMIYSMKQVITRLNKISSSDERSKLIEDSTSSEVLEYQKKYSDLTDKFLFPEKKINKIENNKSLIKYHVDKDLLDSVKHYINVKTNGDVGKHTFNYFVKMKEINNE